MILLLPRFGACTVCSMGLPICRMVSFLLLAPSAIGLQDSRPPLSALSIGWIVLECEWEGSEVVACISVVG